MKVLLFRHGAVQQKEGKTFIGRTDLPLNAEGRRQADAWKRCFQDPPDMVVSSPLSRTMEFARIIAGNRSGDVAVCPEFSEIDLGDWDGRPMHEIQQTDLAVWRERGEHLARFRPPGGESFKDVEKRVVPAFEKLSTHNVSELVVISHAGVNRVILCYLLGIPLQYLFRIGQDYACLNVIEIGPGRRYVKCMNVPCPAKSGSITGSFKPGND